MLVVSTVVVVVVVVVAAAAAAVVAAVAVVVAVVVVSSVALLVSAQIHGPFSPPPGVAPTPVSLEKLCPCLARAEPPPLGEAPLGPHAPPGWKARVQVWEV